MPYHHHHLQKLVNKEKMCRRTSLMGTHHTILKGHVVFFAIFTLHYSHKAKSSVLRPNQHFLRPWCQINNSQGRCAKSTFYKVVGRRGIFQGRGPYSRLRSHINNFSRPWGQVNFTKRPWGQDNLIKRPWAKSTQSRGHGAK